MRQGLPITLCCVFAIAHAGAPTSLADEPAVPTLTRVLVLPFESLSTDADATTLVIQRSLMLELGRSQHLHAAESKNAAPDAAVAVAEGKAEGAAFVVSASVQVAEGRVRVIGQVLGVDREPQVSHFKLTGTLAELFELEDLLAEQVRRRAMKPVQGTNETPEPIEIPPSQPLRVASRRAEAPLDAITWRYNFAHEPYWSVPYGYYRPYRSLYQGRFDDYTYRGLPDRRFYRGFGPRVQRSFNGPVPLRWLRPR